MGHASHGRCGCSGTAITGSSSRVGTAIEIGVAPPGSSLSFPCCGWAKGHFFKPFAPLAFKNTFLTAIHLNYTAGTRGPSENSPAARRGTVNSPSDHSPFRGAEFDAAERFSEPL